MVVTSFLWLVAAFFTGSLPIGYLIVSYRKGVDVRQHGSGNSGATNVARLLGLRYFFITFLLDAGKAYTLLFLARMMGLSDDMLIGMMVALVAGNTLSPFLRFNGGKGVATAVGSLAAISPLLTGLMVVTWLLTFAVVRVVGVASVVALSMLPVFALFWGYSSTALFGYTLVALWIIYRHRTNLVRYFQ